MGIERTDKGSERSSISLMHLAISFNAKWALGDSDVMGSGVYIVRTTPERSFTNCPFDTSRFVLLPAIARDMEQGSLRPRVGFFRIDLLV
jgi:hypothetical protein